MKIFEKIKTKYEKKIKLFGFPLMVQTLDYMTGTKYQSLIGELITSVRIKDPDTYSINKDVKFLGKSLIQRIEDDNSKSYYLFNKKVYSISFFEKFKKQYLEIFDKKCDDIYILRANSGEAYLVLAYLINALLKKHNSKNPLLVATKKYHMDMIKMLCPSIPHIYIEDFDFSIKQDSFKIDNFNFHILFGFKYFKQLIKDIRTHELGQIHYYKSMLNTLNLNEEELEINKMQVLPNAEESMLEKVKNEGLNLEKFVFIAPEAQSCELYDDYFWSLLINKFKDKGYDAFVNLTGNKINLSEAVDFKSCRLNYAEAFALAKKSKKIVSLRSGFSEFLLQTNVPMDILYTKFAQHVFTNAIDVYQVMSAYSVYPLPLDDKTKIREFNMFEISQKDCLDKLLEL